MSNRVKVTVKSRALRRRLIADLKRGGYDPFVVTDGQYHEWCAAVSILDPLPHLVSKGGAGTGAVVIAARTIRKHGSIDNPCVYQVVSGSKAAA